VHINRRIFLQYNYADQVFEKSSYSFGRFGDQSNLLTQTHLGLGSLTSDDSQANETAHDISTSRAYEDLDQWPEHHELSRLTENRT
jgi:hypothetical protein